MAGLTRFNSLRGLARFDPLGREREDLFQGFLLTPLPLQQMSNGQIPIDVTEDEKKLQGARRNPGF